MYNIHEFTELSFTQFVNSNKKISQYSLTEQIKHYNQYLLEIAAIQQQVVNSINSGEQSGVAGASATPISGSGGGSPIVPVSIPAASPIPDPSVTPTPSISIVPSVTPTPSISIVPSITPTPTLTPTPTPSPVVGRLNGIRVIAGSFNSMSTTNINGLISEITSLGYPAPNVITSSLIGNTYTGDDLDPAFDDILIICPGSWAQIATSNVGAPELANNVKTYLNNGGKVMWTTYFSYSALGGASGSFDFAMTPYSASGVSTGAQLGGTPGNIIFESAGVGHPITNGVTPNTNLAANLNMAFNNIKTNINTRPGATTIMSLGNPANTSNANRYALVQTMLYAGNRVSMYNNATLEGFTAANTNPVARRIFANTVLWTAGMI